MADLFGTFAEIGLTMLNNHLAQQRSDRDRAENYKYGEMAAENADARSRALYKDFYSPQALLKQYNAAGLSPSMMFGGTPGQGGMSGAQGTGSAGMQTPFMPFSMVEAAQADALLAQTRKTDAETENIKQDTSLKKGQTNAVNLENISRELTANMDRTTLNIINTQVKLNDDNTSLYQIAEKCKTYDEFINMSKTAAESQLFNNDVQTEAGQKTMREIWTAAKTMDNEIAIISGNKTITTNEAEQSAYTAAIERCNKQIAETLINNGFAAKNAQAQIAMLEQTIQESELNSELKGAWNRLIGKMKDGTTKDILIVLALIFGQAMSKMTPNVGISVKK